MFILLSVTGMHFYCVVIAAAVSKTAGLTDGSTASNSVRSWRSRANDACRCSDWLYGCLSWQRLNETTSPMFGGSWQ